MREGRELCVSAASMGPALFTRENLLALMWHSSTITLQWGPRCSRGKTWDRSALSSKGRVASMGPALFTRENADRAKSTKRPPTLQWGPRCSRGKTLPRNEHSASRSRFNGARVVHAGKRDSSAQWADFAAERFNGARVVHAGKLGLLNPALAA